MAHLVVAGRTRGPALGPDIDVSLGRTAMRTVLRITDGLLETIHADLSRPHPFAGERAGFLTCGVASLPSGEVGLYGATYYPVADDDYEDDPGAAAMLGSGAFRKILQRIYAKPSSVLHVHRHDHYGCPGPSITDQRESQHFVPSFWNVCPNYPHGTLILSFDDLWGALWIKPKCPIVELSSCVVVGDRTKPYGGWNDGAG